MNDRRYAWQSLLDALNLTDSTAKTRLGLDCRQVARYRSAGLTERRADELAVKGGLVPWQVWPELLDHALEDGRRAEEEARAAKRVSDRRRKAARWASDPEYRARKAEYMRRYREEGRRALAAHKRRWYAQNRARVLASNRRSTAAWKARNPEKNAEQRRQQRLRRKERLAA